MSKSFRVWLTVLIRYSMYYVGWFLDNIILTFFNFIICVPMTYLNWCDGAYWSPIERKVITEYPEVPTAARMSVSIISLVAIMLISGIIYSACGTSSWRSLIFSAITAISLPTLSFIIRFCIKAVKLYRLVKSDSQK